MHYIGFFCPQGVSKLSVLSGVCHTAVRPHPPQEHRTKRLKQENYKFPDNDINGFDVTRFL